MTLDKVFETQKFVSHFFWDDTYTYGEWKIQHHKTNFFNSKVKPYRLLDPDDNLITSADSEKELKKYLNNLLKN